MKNLERAIEVGQALKAALEKEVVRAQGERLLVRQFDVEGLFRRAAERTAWNGEVARLQDALAASLQAVASDHGLAEVSIERLTLLAPEPARRLSAVFSEVRALAGALSELDELNRTLSQKASAVVKGYLQALSLSTGGYDRRGGAAPSSASTFSGTA